jgi:hypothetical protein
VARDRRRRDGLLEGAMIAATVHKFTVVTRNLADFANTDVHRCRTRSNC